MGKVLVLYHSQEHMNTDKMAAAVAEGVEAGGAEVLIVNTDVKRFDIEEYRSCDALAVGSPDYYSYLAGGVKMFFDDWYIAKNINDEGLGAKPVGIFYTHGGGGSVIDSLENLALKLGEQVGQTIESKGLPDEATLEQCRELGKALAGKV